MLWEDAKSCAERATQPLSFELAAAAGIPASPSSAPSVGPPSSTLSQRRTMRPSSPRTAQYERLEDGMLGVPARAARRLGWPRILVGAAVIIGLLYIVSPSGRSYGLNPYGDGAGDPYDPLAPLPDTVRPSDPYTPSKSSAIKSPLNFEADTDPSGTVHCTVPHVPSGRIVQYALMIDAGSTGSRIHVYKFNNCGPSPMYEYETFKNIKGGLSSYKTNPQGAAASLDTLLKEALRVVPPALHKCTPVAVKATAGLRLLGATQSEAILRAVYDRLNTEYPFPIHKGTDGVAIMDGAEEGVFAWVTANYLLGAIGGNGNAPAGSHAVFDLGGASTQIVFEPAFTKSGALEPGEHKYDLDFAGTRHVLYQHSYLGYGLMRARAHVHQLVDFMASIRASEGKTPAQSEIPNPCLARDTRRTVEVEDPRSPDKRNVTMVGADVGSFDACNRIVELVMAKDALCTVKPCSFNGVYQPNLLETFPAGKVLLLSYFYDRLSPLHPPSEYDAGLSVETIAKDAKDVCAGEQAWRARWGNMPGVFEELADRPEHCLDLTFMHALLRLGYEFGPDRAIRIGKQIEGTELGWCLGATLAMVAGELTCRA